jgi:hypothetical protein
MAPFRRSFGWIAASLIFCVLQTIAFPSSCIVFTGSRTFDLSELKGSGGSELALHYTSYEPSSLGWTYSFSSCGDAVLPASCSGAAPHAAAVQKTRGACYSLGASTTRTVTETAVGVALAFTGGDGGRSSSVSVECADVRRPELLRWVGVAAPSTYAAFFRARAGCALECGRSATGAVCGGEANGACVAESASGPASCVCASGRAGAACMDIYNGNNPSGEISLYGADIIVFAVASVIIVHFCCMRCVFCRPQQLGLSSFPLLRTALLAAAAAATAAAAMIGGLGFTSGTVAAYMLHSTATSQLHLVQPSCLVEADTRSFDLSALSGAASLYYESRHFPGHGERSTFAFSVCGNATPLHQQNNGSCAGSAVLQDSSGGCLSLGAPHSRTAVPTSRGLMLSYSGGGRCGTSNQEMSTTILIECANVPQPLVVRWSKSSACAFSALVGSRAGCGVSQIFGPAMSSSAPLSIAVYGMFGDAGIVLDELWILSDIIFHAVNRVAVPVSPRLAKEDAFGIADVILIGPFDSRANADSVIGRYKATAVTIFVATENTDLPTTAGEFADQLAGSVAISFGHRRDTPLDPQGNEIGAYLRLPGWLTSIVHHETGACELPELPSFDSGDAESWLARPGFAALISSHTAYPRELLFNLAMTLGHVDAPGKAFHNSEWPATLPNDLKFGKVGYLRGFRFNICPENSRTSGTGGYNTEKLAQALLAGAVPIYWGDAIDTEVFNPARVIVFDGTNADAVLEMMRMLQDNRSFRENWFRQPVLAPTAGAWVKGWCAEASRLFQNALAALSKK